MSKPTALILLATCTNRDQDVAHALELAGARPEVVPLNSLRESKRRWQDYRMLVLAGGFSYAGALGAGKLLALDLQAYFAEEVNAFVHQGKPLIGICNDFQALVKSGKDRYGTGQGKAGKLVPEGVEGMVPQKGALGDFIYQLVGGLRSGMGYAGAKSLQDLRSQTQLTRITNAGLIESHPHHITITREAPNYRRNE